MALQDGVVYSHNFDVYQEFPYNGTIVRNTFDSNFGDTNLFSANIIGEGTCFGDQAGHDNGSCILWQGNCFAALQPDFYIDDNFSLSVWINKSSLPYGQENIFSNFSYLYGNFYDGNVQVYLNSAGQIGFEIFGNDYQHYIATSSSAISLYSWENIICIKDGTNLKIYLNGVLVGQSSCSSGIYPATFTAAIASDYNSEIYSHYFYGYIDDFILWNRVITPSEISQVLNPSSAFVSNLTCSQVNSNNIVLTWDSFSGASSYEVIRTTPENEYNSWIVTSSTISFSGTDVKDGTNYTFAVKPLGNGLYGEYSFISVSVPIPSTPVVSVQYDPNSYGRRVIISWNHTTDNRDGYYVKIRYGNEYDWSATYTLGPNETSYTLDLIHDWPSLLATVAAYKGNNVGPFTQYSWVELRAFPPTNLVNYKSYYNSALCSFQIQTPDLHSTEYGLSTDGTNWISPSLTGSPYSPIELFNLQPNTQYYLRIRCTGTNHYVGTYSEILTFWTNNIHPVAPANFSMNYQGTRLTWTDSADFDTLTSKTAYIEISSNGTDYTSIGSTPASNGYFDTVAPAGITSYYRIHIENQSNTISDYATCSYSGSNPSYDLNTGLQGYYSLSETTGNVMPSYGAVSGTLVSSPSRGVSGKNGNAYFFGGYQNPAYKSAINMGVDSFRFTSDFTISGWINIQSLSYQSAFFTRYFSASGYRCYYTGIGTSGQIYFQVWNPSNTVTAITSPNNTIVPGNWYHLAFSKSGSSMKIYVNNSVVASTNSAPFSIRDQAGSTSNLMTYLGASAKSNTIPDGFFSGYIDEIGVWNIGLPDEGITSLWNSGMGRFYPFN